jgi:hypothetical protein
MIYPLNNYRRKCIGYFPSTDSDLLMARFVLMDRKQIIFWAEQVKNSKQSMTYDTFKTRLREYLRRKKQTLSANQTDRIKLPMDMAHQYAKLYLEVLSTSPTMNLPMFFEKYIIVPPFNNVPSYEQFKKKIIPLIHQLHKLQLRPIFKSAGYDCSVVEECSVIHSAYEENTDSEFSVDTVRSNVAASSRVDTACRQATGSLEGNGSCGPIYGELSGLFSLQASTAVDCSVTDCSVVDYSAVDCSVMDCSEGSVAEECSVADCSVVDYSVAEECSGADCSVVDYSVVEECSGADCSVVEKCSVIHSAYEENTDSKFSVDTMRSNVVASSRVDTAYRCIRQATGSLGGNGSGGPIYGELTVGSMQNIINFLVTFCALNPLSRFLDVGAGLGKPNFHVAQDPGVCLSIGVEVEPIRWRVSLIHICFNLYLHLHSFNTLFMCIF